MFRFVDLLLFSLERLWQHRILVLWTLLGLTSAATLAISVVLYVDAVNNGLLGSHLGNPPYAFRFRHLGAWNGNITEGDVVAATAAVHDRLTETIALPVSRTVLYARGGAWSVSTAGSKPVTLGAFSLGILQGADDQMTITAGAWPVIVAAGDDAIPVLVSEKMLYTMGVQVGDTLMAARPGGKPIALKVAALWTPTNPDDPGWIFAPKYFDQVFLVQPDTFWKTLEGIERPVEETAWSVVFDGRQVKTADVEGLLGRIADSQRDVTASLPGIRLDLSPVDNLTAFSQEVNRLTQQLIIMILPVGGLVLYFVSLVAGLLVSRQQLEDVKLGSRGMSRGAILGIHVRMWLLLAGIALAAGVALSPLVVRLVGQTTSFLRFDDTGSILVVTYTSQALLAGALTSLTAASTGLFMAWRTTRQTITSFKQSTGRAGKAWWQRAYLDVLLLIPAVYVLYTLWRQGGLTASAEDPFNDPLTYLGPTLFSLSVTLLFLRLWQVVMRAGAGLIAYSRSIALMMALRELTRSIGRYRGTLLMMGFTLSLSGFTASMASTLDRSLKDSIDYRIGADAVAITAADAQTEAGATDATTGQTTLTVTGYNALPAEDFLTIKGVGNVSRAGRYQAQLVLASQRVDGTVLGVDRAAIAAVTRARFDYAAEPYADLFNGLAGNRTGVILNTAAAQKYNLRINQEINLQVLALNTWYQMTVPIVGLVDYFPTLDPGTGFFAVMNLDPIFEAVGTELPTDYWLSLKPGADPDAVRQAAIQLGFPVLEWRDPQAALHTAEAAPSRRGVLGFLSVGFIAAIVLTLVGAVIQTTASFRAQATQLGSLRAMGLDGKVVGAYLTLVQGIAASSGIIGGTSIGLATTLLFLPLLDFSGGLPPYLVRVAWGDIIAVYAVFAGVLFFVTITMTTALGRESLAAVVKLGDV